VKSGLLRIVKVWWPAVLWMLVIFMLSTEFFSGSNTSSLLQPLLAALFPQLSVEHIETIHSLLRKLAHWFGYFILGLLTMRSMRAQFSFQQPERLVAYSLIFAIFYAAADEWHQSFVPSRSASIFDVLLDNFGAFCGVFFYRKLTGDDGNLKQNRKKLDKLRSNREDISTIHNKIE